MFSLANFFFTDKRQADDMGGPGGGWWSVLGRPPRVLFNYNLNIQFSHFKRMDESTLLFPTKILSGQRHQLYILRHTEICIKKKKIHTKKICPIIENMIYYFNIYKYLYNHLGKWSAVHCLEIVAVSWRQSCITRGTWQVYDHHSLCLSKDVQFGP